METTNNYLLSKKHPQQRAFITGGGSGLGRALALELARDGWTIGLADIDLQRLEKVSEEIKILGGKAFTYQLNVADREAYTQVSRQFLADAGGIDLLFNNAGVGDGAMFEEYSLDNWEWMIGINQMGVIYGCHLFIPVMKAQKSGHIISTASAAAIASGPGMSTYNMTKAAVVSISETLYTELSDFNIQVSVIQPWFFKTNIVQHARGGDAVRIQAHKMMEQATITAEQVAQQTLKMAGKGKLYILLPFQTKVMWWLKRLSPYLLFRQLKKMSDKILKETEAALQNQSPSSQEEQKTSKVLK
ncbi:MAG TPA: short chain dehydrogenase [Microscillaceae bacterium]|jgi:NADP-dependent 3-hydroxy acid dehydrogenase YdfG|nr:short chain dehydrogenase [Microscillaceae bacterium]